MKQYCIYIIENQSNKKIYLGSTTDPERRKNDHFYQLRIGKHHSIKLQNAYKKYGKEAFVFKILEIADLTDKNGQFDREQEYINIFFPHIEGYNMSSNSRTGASDIVWTEEKKKLMGEKVSRKHKGKVPRNLENVRIAQRRAVVEYENGLVVREYDSCKQAGEFLGIDYKLINNVLRGKVKQCRKYPRKTWQYRDLSPIRKIEYNSKSAWKKGREFEFKNHQKLVR